MIRECIVLAGGLGTRLRSAVPDLPKCMAGVAGKPFLGWVMDYFLQQGIERFVLSLGYKHEVIEAYVHDRYQSVPVQFAVEPEPLGTGGGIRLACTLTTDENVLIVNGDTLFKIQLAQLATFHELHQADCTLVLKPMAQFDRYGVVTTDESHRIRSFQEKKWYEKGNITGGVYALQREKFLTEALPQKFSFEKDYLEKLYPERPLYGMLQDEYFIDIGIPEDYKKANEEFQNIC